MIVNLGVLIVLGLYSGLPETETAVPDSGLRRDSLLWNLRAFWSLVPVPLQLPF